MAYDLYDFTESLSRCSKEEHGFNKEDVETCLAAWGHSPEDYASWEGGFLLKLKDGKFAYLSGWCDTTGWGCQDGIESKITQYKPKLDEIAPGYEWATKPFDWDTTPTDINRYLRGEIDEWGEPA